MSQLVSSTLLIGPGRVAAVRSSSCAPSTSFAPLRPGAIRALALPLRAAPAPCRRLHRIAGPSLPSHDRPQLRPPRPGLPASFFTSSRIQAHSVLAEADRDPGTTLTEAYRPSSDDPFVTRTHPPPPPALYKPLPATSLKTISSSWRALAKSRLTFLMVLTGMAGYALVPASLAVGPTSVATLLALTAGMTLCSSSANAMNQFLEAPYDAQMLRTRARPLPSRQVTQLHAFGFAAATGVTGVGLLAAAVNPLTAALGAANIVLYAGVYTPMKRLSMANTWVGAVVGAIPPLMGWVASTGTLLQPTDVPAWILAGILFAWQFPHFNSLAHNVRADYAKGGYRMMSVLDPALNRRTALRYAVALLPLCWALPFSGSAVLPVYAALSTLPNAALLQATWRWYGDGAEASARRCFFVSLWHLAVVMMLAMACKQDVWSAIKRRLVGSTEQKRRTSM